MWWFMIKCPRASSRSVSATVLSYMLLPSAYGALFLAKGEIQLLSSSFARWTLPLLRAARCPFESSSSRLSFSTTSFKSSRFFLHPLSSWEPMQPGCQASRDNQHILALGRGCLQLVKLLALVKWHPNPPSA